MEEDVSSLEERRALVTSKEIWEDVSDVMAKAAIGHPRKSERKLALAAVVIKLAYLTWQRLGAIVNTNMDEYESLTRDIDEETRENCCVMLVAQHKTARQGPTSITLSKKDKTLLHEYVERIRPLCNPRTSVCS